MITYNPRPLLGVNWLAANSNHPKLIILDASLKKTAGSSILQEDELVIPASVFFDMAAFSDSESLLPHTMPSPSLFTKAAKKLGINKDSLIVVYDRMGIYSSPRVWWMFHVMGFRNVFVLDGGLPAWLKAGYGCESSRAMPIRDGDFEANYQPALISDWQEVLAATLDKSKLIVDVRTADRFYGTAGEPRPGLRSGHIPGAVNIPFESLQKDHYMLNEQQLKIILNKVANADQHLIFSCGSGVTACIGVLAAVIAGYRHISVYDGSWSEWGAAIQLPVA